MVLTVSKITYLKEVLKAARERLSLRYGSDCIVGTTRVKPGVVELHEHIHKKKMFISLFTIVFFTDEYIRDN